MGKKLRFFAGALMVAAAGVGIGMLLAPRSGAESRAMAADAMNDAWDSAMDTYEQGAKTVKDTVNGFRPQVDVATDELRAKVLQAPPHLKRPSEGAEGAGHRAAHAHIFPIKHASPSPF